MAKVVRKRISLIVFILSILLTVIFVTRVQALDSGVPTISNISPGDNTVISTNYTTVQFTVTDPDDDIASSGVSNDYGYTETYNSPSDNDNFYVKIDGKLVASNLQYSGHDYWYPYADSPTWIVDSYRSATIQANISGLGETIHTVEVKAMDKSGNVVTKSWSFKVGIPPTISNFSPAQNVTTNNNQSVSAIVTDNQLQPDSILMTIDGKLVPYFFDSTTGKVTYNALTPLVDGLHIV